MTNPLPPGSTIGVIGGGQLGLMLVEAAHALGYPVHVLARERCSPAGRIADRESIGDWRDPAVVRAFAATVAALTIETESVPWECLAAAEEVTLVRPGSAVVRWTQNRLEQRAFHARNGFPVGPSLALSAPGHARRAAALLGLPLYLKLAQSGYDGRGQVRIDSAEDAEAAWAELGGQPAIGEAAIPFTQEFTIIAARDAAGRCVVYPPIATTHTGGVLDIAMAPANLAPRTVAKADSAVRCIAAESGLIGLLCVECYAMPDGSILINEAAARPHNAGHLTVEACATSQFEQLIRVVAGLPLGPTELRWPAAMANILAGHAYAPSGRASLGGASIFVHDYGKEPRPGRKIGHVTACAASTDHASAAAQATRAALAVPTVP